MLSRSAAETRQLEFLSDISCLKLRYAAVEKDNMDLRGQLNWSEQDMIILVSQVKSVVSYKYFVQLKMNLISHSVTLSVGPHWGLDLIKRYSILN
jgi:hypothetical protein